MALMIVLFIFCGLILISILSICYDTRAYRARSTAQKHARTEVRQYLPAIRAKVEEDRRYELTSIELQQKQQKLDLEQTRLTLDIWKARTWVEPGQHGIYRIDMEDGNVLPIAPLTRIASKSVESQAVVGNAVPSPYDMREIWMSGFKPSKSGIWLAKGAETSLIVPSNKLLHAIACGPTGGGKTNVVRTLLAQLVYIGCEVTLMDIHYAAIKEDEDGNPIDWRPIVDHLAQEPIYDLSLIIKWMQWLAYTELENRITRQREGYPIGKPIYFTIAELPAVLDEAKDAIASPLAKLLRQGRQYLIFFVGDSQDLLTETLKMTTGPRECFRTGFYTGGDPTTAKALLDLPKGETISEEGLGQNGLVYVKTAIHPYTQARAGWMSNEALYDLFNTPTYEQLTGGHWDFSQNGRTSHSGRIDRNFAEVPEDEVVDADSPENGTSAKVLSFSQHGKNAPAACSDVQSEESPKVYRLSDKEISQFLAAYRASNNIERALGAINRGSRYKEHARELLKAHGLKREEM